MRHLLPRTDIFPLSSSSILGQLNSELDFCQLFINVTHDDAEVAWRSLSLKVPTGGVQLSLSGDPPDWNNNKIAQQAQTKTKKIC